MQTRRLFVGLSLSSKLRKRLASLVSDWANYPLILTREGNFHVTLLFLGFVNEEEISRITESLEEAVTGHDPFDLTFSAITFAPKSDHPTMVWLTGEPSEELNHLRNGIEKELDFLGPDSKTFRPHVTLAKVRRGLWEKLETKPELEKKMFLGESIGSVTLFESTTENGKRVYLSLEEFPLGA